MANTLTLEQIAEAGPALRQAIYHMVEMWDALREAEQILDIDVVDEDISGFASACNYPHDAMAVSNDDLLTVLQEIHNSEVHNG